MRDILHAWPIFSEEVADLLLTDPKLKSLTPSSDQWTYRNLSNLAILGITQHFVERMRIFDFAEFFTGAWSMGHSSVLGFQMASTCEGFWWVHTVSFFGMRYAPNLLFW